MMGKKCFMCGEKTNISIFESKLACCKKCGKDGYKGNYASQESDVE